MTTTIRERLRRRYAASFNWERVGFRSRWIAAVVYLKRGTYEIWLEHGGRFKIGEPTQTMIEDAGPPATFVQDRLTDMIEPEVAE